MLNKVLVIMFALTGSMWLHNQYGMTDHTATEK